MFLIASGGNAGEGPNPAIRLIAAPGYVKGSREVVINELTTVAAVFVHLGAAQSEMARRSFQAGLTRDSYGLLLDRGSIATALVDPELGTLRPIFHEGANTPALMNTLADIIVACVRSSGPQSGTCSELCASAPIALRGDPPYVGLREPTDTIMALQNIALSPAHNVAQLFSLVPSKPPYLPLLATAPHEFMIALNFTRGGLKHPAGIAIDRFSKTVWVANEGSNGVVELGANSDNFGVPLSPPGAFAGNVLSAPTAIRFVSILGEPTSGKPQRPSLWVANRGNDSLTEIALPPWGEIGPPKLIKITGNGLRAPIDLVENSPDSYSDQMITVANSGSDRISFFRPRDGTPCGEPLRIPGLRHAAGIGGCGNRIWVADDATNRLFEIKRPDFECKGTQMLRTITNQALSKPHFIAYGMESGTITVTNSGTNSISVFDCDSAGVPKEIQGSPFKGGGLAGPAGVVIDGDANAWVANNAVGANSISEIGHVTKMFGPTGMPLSLGAGFDGPGLNRPFGIAIDGSGDVWVTNQEGNSVTVFFGVALAPF